MKNLSRMAGLLVLFASATFVAGRIAPPVHAAQAEYMPAGAGFQAQKKHADPDVPLPDGEGKELTQKLCSKCHGNNVWTGQRHTSEKWSSIIDNMTAKGMVASDEDLAKVNDYLALYFGPAKTDAPPPPAAPPAR